MKLMAKLIESCSISIPLNRGSDQLFSVAAKRRRRAESALCSKMYTGPVDICKVKRSQRHHLAAIENNLSEAQTLYF